MKEKIHPKYMQAKIVCACGRSYTTGSTTGTQHILDVQGRVERFTKRYAKKEQAAPSATAEAAPHR